MTNLEFATELVQRLNFLLCSPAVKRAMKALLECKIRIPPKTVEPPWATVAPNNELGVLGVLNSLIGLYCQERIGIECVAEDHEDNIAFRVTHKAKEQGAPETSHMRAILEFDLPDAKMELKMAYHGSDYFMVLTQLDNNLRGVVKYGAALDHSPDLPEDDREHYAKVRTHLWQLMEDYGVDLNEG